MEFFLSLKNSFLLPKKSALFRLNRISMRNTIVYISIILFLLFVPDVIQMIIQFEHTNIPRSMYILQLCVIYPFLIIFLAVTGISLLAGISYILKGILRRKLAYQQLWKMTAFALTTPLILHVLFKHTIHFPLITNGLPLLVLYSIMYRMIITYPKKRWN
ncbi:Protein of unknown function [Salinibacillus kushneri]|uniref:DUF1189 domain-containing protein n=1 Tax=Salinibacillus kushneri TaxID=237682 RepID=A0A1I0ISK3_9BACI|nr:DUF1189 family protein [Salinibacillus kushneri]SET99500.1 Protein of unknown function [Salinibacillus kushneri]